MVFVLIFGSRLLGTASVTESCFFNDVQALKEIVVKCSVEFTKSSVYDES